MSKYSKFEAAPATLSAEAVLEALKVEAAQGLSESEVAKRLEASGLNVIAKAGGRSWLTIIFAQLLNPLVGVLIVAGIVTVWFHEYTDTLVIGLAFLINFVIGLWQEYRAGKAFDALSSAQTRRALVLREGKKQMIAAEHLVPGDVVFLEGGSTVPADIRLIFERGLTAQEAALTGEWVGVEKQSAAVSKETSTLESSSIAWMGTVVLSGSGRGVVVATGSDTQIGQIALAATEATREKTPLEQSMAELSRLLMVAVLVAVGLIFGLGVLRGSEVGEMFITSIAVAVSILPEGLPAAVTVVLALSMEAILKRGGLVKSLLAAETLGGATVILTDKTGTITEGDMSLVHIFSASHLEATKTLIGTAEQRSVLRAAAGASDAFVETRAEETIVHGRPIERAITKALISEKVIDELAAERLDLLPFQSARRFSVSLNKVRETTYLYFSGAPETLLTACSKILIGSEEQKLTDAIREQFSEVQSREAASGKRFIAAARRETTKTELKENESLQAELKEATFLGLLAFADPIRADVPKAVEEIQKAGAKVYMVTGDYPGTALSIAKEAGIASGGMRALTGAEIENLSDSDLVNTLQDTRVLARVLPAQKLRISKLLQSEGEVVAMTGDGINDAPALRGATIGVAVGSGTEVAKEAADMILLDNSFAVITAAVREGRRLVDNLRKIVIFMLATNLSEFVLIFGALLLKLPIPLLAAQILWVNIIGEGLFNFAFAFEKAESGIMKRSPKEAAASNLFSVGARSLIVLVGVGLGGMLLLLYWWSLRSGLTLESARVVIFVGLSLATFTTAFLLKNYTASVMDIDFSTNRFLLVAALVGVLLLAAALSVPAVSALLQLEAVSSQALLLGLTPLLGTLLVVEWAKLMVRLRTHS